MAQISNKFIADDAVNESKFKLSNDAALRARNNADSADVDLFKLDTSDILQFLTHPRISTSASNSDDILTKKDQDAALEGLKPKEAVRAATTANITLSGTQTVDGVSLVADDRVLVKDQTTASENGIYVVAAGAWSRADDMNSATEVPGAYTFVQEGTTQTGYGYVQYGAFATLDTDNMTWTVRSNFDLTGGNGIDITGNTFSVDHDGEGLTFAAGQLALELDGSTLSKSASGVKVADNGIGEAQLAADVDADSFQLSAGYAPATGTVTIGDTVEVAIEKLQGNFAARTPDDIDLTAGYAASAGTVTIGDSVEVAIEKLDGNIGALTAESIALTAGYAPAAGTVTIGDSVEVAIEKLDGNIGALDANSLAISGTYDSSVATGNVTAGDTIEEAIERVEKKVDDVAASSANFSQETFALLAGDITNQYVDLANTPTAGSVILTPADGPMQIEGVDYTISSNRVTFAGDLATGGDAALVAGDTIYIKYSY